MDLDLLNNSMAVFFGSILLLPFLVVLLYWILNNGFDKLKDLMK